MYDGRTMASYLWAEQFREIPATLAVRPDLRAAMRRLLAQHELPCEATEGGDRDAQRRSILGASIEGALALEEAAAALEARLPREASPHRASSVVFASGWAHRLIHTQISVLYSWAVLDQLAAAGHTRCFVAHSAAEAPTTTCARLLAGRDHAIAGLRERLIDVHVAREPSREPLVPNHPHCAHVISPVPVALQRAALASAARASAEPRRD